jgi:hypothetical protein
MSRRFAFMTATIGSIAVVLGGISADVYAQSGIGGGRGAAPTVGQGRSSTTGRPATAGRPAQSSTNAGKPEIAGQPTIGDRLTRDRGLGMQLQKLFPEGTDLVEASKDFRNLGQFVAAAHVADNNPNVTFDELKAKMLEGNGMSLGEAIHALDPGADATAEAHTAEQQADADLKAAGKTK